MDHPAALATAVAAAPRAERAWWPAPIADAVRDAAGNRARVVHHTWCRYNIDWPLHEIAISNIVLCGWPAPIADAVRDAAGDRARVVHHTWYEQRVYIQRGDEHTRTGN